MSEPRTEALELSADPSAAAAVAVAPAPAPTRAGDADALVEQELLVEDVSIDGMCGVY